MSNSLTARFTSVDDLSSAMRVGMFAIYSKYYAATDADRFAGDLEGKTHVLLLLDEQKTVRGFTTLTRYFRTEHEMEGALAPGIERCQVVFSGDTIIEHDYWGQQVLPMAWIEQTGKFKAEHPELPLYWFLIVKGYRTYRYLSIFSKRYYPSVKVQSDENLEATREVLAVDRFGKAYQRESGCIIFPESRGHLSGDWADIPERVKSRPEVLFFLEQNPDYHKGHELACITELHSENLTSRAKVAFERGLHQ